MGMFDTLIVRCPKCGKRVDFQSKGGPCILSEYTLSNVPANVAGDLDGDHEYCKECDTKVVIRTQCMVSVEIGSNDEDEEDFEDFD